MRERERERDRERESKDAIELVEWKIFNNMNTKE